MWYWDEENKGYVSFVISKDAVEKIEKLMDNFKKAEDVDDSIFKDNSWRFWRKFDPNIIRKARSKYWYYYVSYCGEHVWCDLTDRGETLKAIRDLTKSGNQLSLTPEQSRILSDFLENW